MAALTLLSILPMAAAIEISALREERKNIGMSESAPRDDSVNGQRAGDGSQAFSANYAGAHGTNDNHLDISTADRNNCVSQKTLGRQALTDGTGCNTATAGATTYADGSTDAPALCVKYYEQKYRGSHRAGDTWSTGVTLVGETHLCEWRSVTPPLSPVGFDDSGSCEAGVAISLCPEDTVVETAADGGEARHPVACVEGTWGAYGTCEAKDATQTCGAGNGQQTRTRTGDVEALYGGEACSSSTETQDCDLGSCTSWTKITEIEPSGTNSFLTNLWEGSTRGYVWEGSTPSAYDGGAALAFPLKAVSTSYGTDLQIKIVVELSTGNVTRFFKGWRLDQVFDLECATSSSWEEFEAYATAEEENWGSPVTSKVQLCKKGWAWKFCLAKTISFTTDRAIMVHNNANTGQVNALFGGTWGTTTPEWSKLFVYAAKIDGSAVDSPMYNRLMYSKDGAISSAPSAADIQAANGKLVIAWSTSSDPSDSNNPYAYDKAVSFTVPGTITATATSSTGKQCSDTAYFTPVDVTCIHGECNMPSQMYVGTGFNSICYGKAFGLVTNQPQNNAQCDWSMDTQEFRSLYIEVATGLTCHGVKDESGTSTTGTSLGAIALFAE